jgi:hypothetical protein
MVVSPQSSKQAGVRERSQPPIIRCVRPSAVNVIKWAVEMERFDESQTLDHLADDDLLDYRMAVQLAARVSAIHRMRRLIKRRVC